VHFDARLSGGIVAIVGRFALVLALMAGAIEAADGSVVGAERYRWIDAATHAALATGTARAAACAARTPRATGALIAVTAQYPERSTQH
jgi:hypothetical protein